MNPLVFLETEYLSVAQEFCIEADGRGAGFMTPWGYIPMFAAPPGEIWLVPGFRGPIVPPQRAP